METLLRLMGTRTIAEFVGALRAIELARPTRFFGVPSIETRVWLIHRDGPRIYDVFSGPVERVRRVYQIRLHDNDKIDIRRNATEDWAPVDFTDYTALAAVARTSKKGLTHDADAEDKILSFLGKPPGQPLRPVRRAGRRFTRRRVAAGKTSIRP